MVDRVGEKSILKVVRELVRAIRSAAERWTHNPETTLIGPGKGQ
jgi:hypothetical protein